MKKYLLIDARGEFEAADADRFLLTAPALKRGGAEVEVFLTQNAVFCARDGVKSGALDAVIAAGVRVHAESFSLRERAIAEHRLRAGVAVAPLGLVIDRLAGGWSALWH